MNQVRSFFVPFPFHTFFFGVFPCLALFSANISQINGLGITFSLLLTIVFAFLSYFTFRLLIRETINAAFFASLFLVFFYHYGHFYTYLGTVQIKGFTLAHHSLLLTFWLIILATGFLLAFKKKIQINLHKVLNFASLLLVLFQALLISRFYFQINSPTSTTSSIEHVKEKPLSQSEPDVYYIILDSYAGERILFEQYGYDNSSFLSSLKELGFYIPEGARSNYYTTIFSMLSTFHMDYLTNIGIPIRLNSEDINYGELTPYLRNNPVRSEFEDRGYQIISFKTGYSWLDWNDADIYFQQEKQSFSSQEFEHLYINTTFLRLLKDTGLFEKTGLETIVTNISQEKIVTDHDGIPGARNRYERLQFTFDQLEKTSEIPGKKFIYVHVLSPHEPYVFDAKGNFDLTNNDSSYITQIKYLNKRMLEVITQILNNSDTPPIIIIQGDHNALDETDPEKVQVLSALYMPGYQGSLLYDEITPVNHFRYIFSNYFGLDTPLIEDLSFVKGSLPYEFLPVKNSPAK